MVAAVIKNAEADRNNENPSYPLNDYESPYWDAMLGYGRQSESGVRVSRDSALTYSAFWRGVIIISESLAKLPLNVYRRLDDESKKRVRNHPLQQFLSRRANPEIKSYDWKRVMAFHMLVHGNGYSWIERSPDGAVQNLWVLDPQNTYPIRVGGKLWYVTQLLPAGESDPEHGMKVLRFPTDDVFHVKGAGFDGFMGLNLIDFARETLGMGLASRKYVTGHFKNGVGANVVMEHPGKLSDVALQKIQDSFRTKYAGIASENKALILREGMKAYTLDLNADKAQLSELNLGTVRDVANFLGVPPHLLGDPNRTSYNSIEMENRSFLDHTLDPRLCQFEQECMDKLLPDGQWMTHLCEFNRDAILQADTKTTVEALESELNSGMITLNEARAVRNRPSFGDIGDYVRMPLNHAVTDQDGNVIAIAVKSTKKKKDDDNDGESEEDDRGVTVSRSAAFDLLLDPVVRMLTRFGKRAQDWAKRPDSFIASVDGIEKQRGDVKRALATPAVFVPDAARFVDEFMDFAAESLRSIASVKADGLAAAAKRWQEEIDSQARNFVRRYLDDGTSSKCTEN